MTEDRIKAIAEEYADMYMGEYIPKISKKDNIRNTFIQEAKRVLSVLCKKYCIVEREKVIELYKKYSLHEKDVQPSRKHFCHGGKNCLRHLFGTSMFNQNKTENETNN